MIFRAQSLRSLNTQRVAKHAQVSKLPCTASQRPISRSGSLAEVTRLPSALESHTDTRTASRPATISSENVEATTAADDRESGNAATLVVVSMGLLLIAGPAYAAYDKSSADQLFKNLAGGAYVILVCFFFYRLFQKRATSGTTQSLRSQVQESLQDEKKAQEAEIEDKPVTPLTALWGAVQAGVICFLLFQVCTLVDGYFEGQDMPEQYTARNITVTLRTVVRGLAYLMTFLFGANCMGLSGLALQLVFFPDKPEAGPQQEDKA